MMPSQKIDVAEKALTLISRRSRTPNDLLHRALAHMNYKTFDVGRLTIFEDPAIAVLNVSPKSENAEANPSVWKRLKEAFYSQKTGMLLSVKVSSLDDTKQTFTVSYVVEDTENQTIQQTEIEAPETFIKDMFSAIPDVSFG